MDWFRLSPLGMGTWEENWNPRFNHLLGLQEQDSVCIPGITDGSIGAQLFMFRQKYRDFHIDTLADEQVMSDLTWDVEKSNALMVGGGISKHHVIWWNQY